MNSLTSLKYSQVYIRREKKKIIRIKLVYAKFFMIYKFMQAHRIKTAIASSKPKIMIAISKNQAAIALFQNWSLI